MHTPQTLPVLVAASAIVALAGCTRPPSARPAASYEDCILDHVTTGMDSNAVSTVRQACRSKFPADTQPTADASDVTLDAAAFERLAYQGTSTNGSFILGVLYNGNPDLTVTEVDLSRTTRADGREQSRTYRTRISVPPYGTSNVRVSVLPGEASDVVGTTLVAARGRPVR